MSDRPYPGLRPFRRDEADIFFGREAQTDQLLDKLTQSRFIAVVGLSGCGKSSLVRAGMMAALESGYVASAGASWRVAEMRPGTSPLRNLAEALFAESALGPELNATSPADTFPFLLSSLRSSHLGLVDVVREARLPRQTNVLLLVDQFEELFRYHRQGGRDETEAFVALLLASVQQTEIPIYMVLTMRSDFIGECTLFYGLPEMLNAGQFLIPRLTREQQREAIVGPARVFGGAVEPKLVNHLLNEMKNDPDQLPVLQHALMRMWQQAQPATENQPATALQIPWTSSGKILTLHEYEQIGGLQSALSNHADEAFAALDKPHQEIAEHLFRCLSERGLDRRDTRRPATISEIASVAATSVVDVMAVADAFRHPDRCFLTPAAEVPLDADSVLDISHESLIRQWQRMNTWVEQEARSAEMYKRLEQTACLWKQGQAALWTTPDLENALAWKEREHPTAEWASRYGRHFNLAIEFLEASLTVRQREREQRERVVRRRQRVQLAFSALVLLVTVLGFNLLMSSRTLERLYVETIASIYSTIAADLQRSLEQAVRFGKPIDKFTGTDKLLEAAKHNILDYVPDITSWDFTRASEMLTIEVALGWFNPVLYESPTSRRNVPNSREYRFQLPEI